MPAVPEPPPILPLNLDLTPLDLLARWPADRPLAMLHSARRDPRWARWSILAEPREFIIIDAAERDPLGRLDAVLAESCVLASAPSRDAAPVPFRGGWIVSFDYELGGRIEPASRDPQRANADASREAHRPLIHLASCPDALVFDHLQRRWWAVGEPAIRNLLVSPPWPPALEREFEVDALVPGLSEPRYLNAAQRVIDYIAAGDVFQVNLTTSWSARFTGSPRALAGRAFAAAQPWYGAYLEWPTGRTSVSLSPELFLAHDARSGRIVTRPIKGTRPAEGDPEELRRAPKDAAELNMIIDLMRNDLGRVAQLGSVRVIEPRQIESHPTVHHAVAEIEARLWPGVRVGEMLRATFPPGSVTGAPKIRAMQIIEELEPEPRGTYCGAIGMISGAGDLSLSVAIRTITLEHPAQPFPAQTLSGTLRYGAGGGIVADSQPRAEHDEMLDKTAVLRQLIGGGAVASGA